MNVNTTIRKYSSRAFILSGHTFRFRWTAQDLEVSRQVLVKFAYWQFKRELIFFVKIEANRNTYVQHKKKLFRYLSFHILSVQKLGSVVQF